MLRQLLSPALALLLSACVASAPDDGAPSGPVQYQTEAGTVTILPVSGDVQTPPIRRSPADRCGANSLQAFVGQRETVFFRYTFPDGTRFIRPGDAVTQDFNARRINFIIGGDGRVREVRCG